MIPRPRAKRLQAGPQWHLQNASALITHKIPAARIIAEVGICMTRATTMMVREEASAEGGVKKNKTVPPNASRPSSMTTAPVSRARTTGTILQVDVTAE